MISKNTLYLRGRSYRHGFRIEGSFVKRKFGKKHMFFKTESEALDAMKSIDNGGVRTQ